jgi:hypothetical protein
MVHPAFSRLPPAPAFAAVRKDKILYPFIEAGFGLNGKKQEAACKATDCLLGWKHSLVCPGAGKRFYDFRLRL